MIAGYFDDHEHPILEITVIGEDSQVKVPALIDTGFDGYLSLPIPVAMSLGLKLIDSALIVLADGSTKTELLFRATVSIGGEKRQARTFLTSGETALIGTQLLKDFTLSIDFPQRKLSLS